MAATLDHYASQQLVELANTRLDMHKTNQREKNLRRAFFEPPAGRQSFKHINFVVAVEPRF